MISPGGLGDATQQSQVYAQTPKIETEIPLPLP